MLLSLNGLFDFLEPLNEYLYDTVSNISITPQSILITLMLIGYGGVVLIDIIHKEMWFLIEFGVGFANAVIAIASVLIWGNKKLIAPLGISIFIWIIIVILNGVLNTNEEGEKTSFIGSADIDLYSLQLCISSAIIFYIARHGDKDLKAFQVMRIMEMMMSSLFTGFVITIMLWIIRLLFVFIFKNKNNKKFKNVFTENKDVPAISAIVPLAITNLLILMVMQ